MKVRRQRHTQAGALAALALGLSVGCGRVASDWSPTSVPPDNGGDGASAPVDDAKVSPERDAIAADGRDTVDAGPGCVAWECPRPPSICVDESTMRWFSAYCGDSGTCELVGRDMPCEPTGIKPDCFEGSCRLVILR